jgi:hypothetical protein
VAAGSPSPSNVCKVFDLDTLGLDLGCLTAVGVCDRVSPVSSSRACFVKPWRKDPVGW